MGSMVEPVFISVSGSVFLVKLQVFTINGGDEICDGAYFHLHEVLCF